MTYRQPFRNDWPITQRYGEQITSKFHTGIDYGCPLGTSILASSDGEVMFAAWDSTGYGNMVIISHAPDCATLYAHLSDISVVCGRTVRQGELIGHSGSTGNSTGPHLHFEARRKWNDYKTHFDPMSLPLMSVDDSIAERREAPTAGSGSLNPGPCMVVAPSGVWAHNDSFTSKAILPYGTELTFTGKTKERGGLKFCECALWIAESDGETTLLQNRQ